MRWPPIRAAALTTARIAFMVAVGAIVVAAATPARAARGSRAVDSTAAERLEPWPYAPHIEPTRFHAAVNHPYFPLVPGTRFVYRETAGGRTSRDEVTVLRETKTILGVTCAVVHDVLKRDSLMIEDTFDWYAQDDAGNVWYFGEDSKEFGPNGRVSTEGSWQAGVSGGQPGIVMPAKAAVGPAYRQEYLPGHAEDMGQIFAVGDTVRVPYGSFAGCLRTREWSLLESGREIKWYAKGVGLVRSRSTSGELSELVEVNRP